MHCSTAQYGTPRPTVPRHCPSGREVWSQLGSNQRPFRCERNALPLSHGTSVERDVIYHPVTPRAQTCTSRAPTPRHPGRHPERHGTARGASWSVPASRQLPHRSSARRLRRMHSGDATGRRRRITPVKFPALPYDGESVSYLAVCAGKRKPIEFWVAPVLHGACGCSAVGSA